MGDVADFLFETDSGEKEGVELSMADFIDVVLQMRGTNSTTVKDIVDLRKYAANQIHLVSNRLDILQKRPADTQRLVCETNNMFIEILEYFESDEWDSEDDDFFFPEPSHTSSPKVLREATVHPLPATVVSLLSSDIDMDNGSVPK